MLQQLFKLLFKLPKCYSSFSQIKSYCTLFSQIKNCFWPALFKVFFFSFCTISFSHFLFFFFFFPSLCSPLCSLFFIAFLCFLLILWWHGGWRLETGLVLRRFRSWCAGWRLEMGLGLRRSRSWHGGLFAPISAWAGCAQRSRSRPQLRYIN